MKHIAIFNDSMEVAGTEIMLVNLLNYLISEGNRVDLYLPQLDEKNTLLTELSPKVEVIYIRKAISARWQRVVGENTMIFFPRLYRLAKGFKFKQYDVVLCFKESFYARLFAKVKTMRVLWIHTMLYKRSYEVRSWKEKLSTWLNKKQIHRANQEYASYNRVICVSDACAQTYRTIVHENEPTGQEIKVVYNALDLDRVRRKSEEEIVVGYNQAITNFVLVTRNSADKRADRLFDTVQRLKDEGYKFHATVIGDGFANEDIKADLLRLGVNDCITLLGQQSNPHPYVKQADWALCVSERESFSLALLEAMALNTPVITTNCGGPADIVDGGKYGILVDNSANGVYLGMKQVLDNPDLKQKYTSNLNAGLSRFSYHGWLAAIGHALNLN